MDIYLPDADYKVCVNLMRPQEVSTVLLTIDTVYNIHHQVNGADKTPFAKHPVVAMWGENLPFLSTYAFVVIEKMREYADHMLQAKASTHADYLRQSGVLDTAEEKISWHLSCATQGPFSMEKPDWLGKPLVHEGYKAMLFRIEPDHYAKVLPSINQYAPLPYVR